MKGYGLMEGQHQYPPMLQRSPDLVMTRPPLQCGGSLSVFVLSPALALAWTVIQSGADPADQDRERSIGLKMDLNAAGVRELQLVPGIGPATAKRIVENRRRLGRFTSMDEIARVRGIGPQTIRQLGSVCFVDDGPVDTLSLHQATASTQR